MSLITVKVNGTDLATFGIITQFAPLLTLPTRRGTNLPEGPRPGQVFIPKIVDASTYSIGITVVGDGAAAHQNMLGRLRDLRRLVFDTEQAITLERDIDYADGLVSATGLAEVIPGQPPTITPGVARWALDFQLLEGGFYGPQQSTTLASGGSTTVDNTGDDRTRKVALAFSGGGPYVLTNTTTGRVLNVPAGTVTVDVWTPTVTSGGLSVLGSTSRTGDAAEAFLFALAKGNNSLSLSGGGQVAVSWQPVYL